MRLPPTEDSATPVAWTAKLRAPLLLLAITALLYLPGTGTIPLMDRDEPRFAHATVEMMQRDTWLIPYFNGEYRFDKPPLTYWWMRLHFALLGVNELAARMHSVISVWLVSLVIFGMTRRLWSERAAWWGAAGWLTSFQALVHGRLCVADMPMVLCVALAMWSLMVLLLREAEDHRRFDRWWWTLWLSLGMGFLAKGPIAWLVPALALLLFRLAFWRKPAPWSRLLAGWGVLVALAPVAAWGIPALIETQGLFWKVGMGEHVVERGARAFNGRAIIPGYYVASAFLSLFPWIVFLPQIIAAARRNWSPRAAFLVAWFAAPQIIFLFYATQLPHYTMPGFPAFFVLLGGALAEVPRRVTYFAGVILGLMAMLAVAVLGVSCTGLIGMDGRLQTALVSVGVVLAALAALGLAACLRSRAGMLASCVALAAALIPLGHALRSMHPAAMLASRLRAVSPDVTPRFVAWQFTEPGLVFYADQRWTMLSSLDRVAERVQSRRADAVMLLVKEWTLSDWLEHWGEHEAFPPTRDHTSQVSSLNTKLDGFEVHELRGLNLARSSWVEVRLLVRRAAPSAAQASASSLHGPASSSLSGPSGPSPSRL